MHKTLLVVLVILQGLTGICQSEFPFPDSAASWTNAYYHYPPPPPGPTLMDLTSYCATGEDTVINTIDYKKIFFCSEGYKGAIREASGQVFFVPGDSLQEYLLYDFDLLYGDTAYNVYHEDHYGYDEGYVSDVRIFSIETWPELPGRKIIQTSEGIWIEGIGALTGLFMNSGANVSNYLIELYCMSYRDTVRYGVASCPVFLGMDDPSDLFHVGLHPNPTLGIVHVAWDPPNVSMRVKLLNSLGQEVLVPIERIEATIAMDLSQVPAGVYLVKTDTDRDRRILRVIRE